MNIDKNYKSITKDYLDLIKDQKYHECINYIYQNFNYIIGMLIDYIAILKTKKHIELHNYSQEIYLHMINEFYSNKISDTIFIDILRYTILHLVYIFHKLKLHEKLTSYIIIIGDSLVKEKLFSLYTLIFYLEARTRKYIYNNLIHVSIDYEFNNRQIALMQINFEGFTLNNRETNSYIWMVNPKNFSKKMTKILVTYLMQTKSIYKILHGSDSLDIPYMYTEMFNNNKDIILKFTKRLIDTRFLCEYFKINVESLNIKCSIYDALLYFHTISIDEYKTLNDINKSIGPIQNISWNIKKISSHHLKYGLYDVLYLKHLLYDIYKHIRLDIPEYTTTFKYIIHIIQFVFLERKNITHVLDISKRDIDSINNYIIKQSDKNITLISIYNNLIENFKIEIENKKFIDINFILSVNYFKNTLNILLKKIVYYVIIKNYTVYINKTDILTEKITLYDIKKELHDNKLYNILKFIKLFEKATEDKILNIL